MVFYILKFVLERPYRRGEPAPLNLFTELYETAIEAFQWVGRKLA